MAKAKKKVKTETTVTLTLSEKEAEYLTAVLGKFNSEGRSKPLNDIWEALEREGLAEDLYDKYAVKNAYNDEAIFCLRFDKV